jgi:predicted nucleotidyltransferase
MERRSGRFVLRLPPDLHARSSEEARRQGISLNEYCREAIEQYADRAASALLTEEGTDEFVAWARELVGDDLEGVVLFGSQARGDARPGSDIDLLIVISSARELERELYRQWDSRSTNRVASPHFTHLPSVVMEAGSLWFEVALDGIVLYDRNGSVRAFLSSIRGATADGRLRRRYAHGHPYWVKEESGAHAE